MNTETQFLADRLLRENAELRRLLDEGLTQLEGTVSVLDNILEKFDVDLEGTTISLYRNSPDKKTLLAKLSLRELLDRNAAFDKRARAKLDEQANDDTLTAAARWVVSDDTGLSSRAIWTHMMGVTPQIHRAWDHPHDARDIGGCFRLLEAVPAWKARLPEMATRSSAWAKLVARWDEIRDCMDKEVGIDWSKGGNASRTYDLMKKILK